MLIAAILILLKGLNNKKLLKKLPKVEEEIQEILNLAPS